MTGVALLLNYVETMIIPGVPTIQKDFATTVGLVAWVTAAFLIVGSAVSPLFGKLGDSYGKKKMFLIALTFYTVGVGLAGLSPSIYFLIAARAIQGIGFAIVPLALAIIAETFPKERIATAQGIVSATFGIGAAAGLVVGSYIIQYVSWQWAFHSAFILSVILFAVVAKGLPSGTPGTGRKVDYSTVGMLMAGISLMLLYLTEAPYVGWYDAYNLGSLMLGAALTVGFFFVESRRANPLIRLDLLRIRNVLVANEVGLISGVAMFMLFYALVYYAEDPTALGLGLGLTTIATGLTIAPATLGMLAAGPGFGRTIIRFGPKPAVIAGAGLAILGTLLFLFDRATRINVAVDAVVAMIGVVGMIIPIVNMITISIPDDSIATGLGMNTMLRNVGGALGAVIGTTVLSTYTTSLTVAPGVTVGFPNSTAFNYVFYVGMGFLVFAILMSLTAKNYTFKGSRMQGGSMSPSGSELPASGVKPQGS
jgi:MFS family permease